jgi:hypothetical protein
VLAEAWALYRRHWAQLMPIATLVYLLLSLVTLLLVWVAGPRLGAVTAVFVTVAGTYWMQGALVEAVDDLRDGRRDLSFSQTLGRVVARLGTLSAAGILAAVGIAFGFAAFVVPGLVLLTIWSLIVPAIVLEQRGVLASFGRSRALVRGNGSNVFAVVFVTLAITIVVGFLVSLAFLPLDGVFWGYAANVLASTLTAPFLALAWTLMYYRLRG